MHKYAYYMVPSLIAEITRHVVAKKLMTLLIRLYKSSPNELLKQKLNRT